jgi:hypothetical protein
MLWFVLLAIAVEAFVISTRATAFHYIEGLGWLDAGPNTAMVITGNGPPYEAQSVTGGPFQMVFGLFSVVVSTLVVSVVLAPVFHRVLPSYNVDPGRGQESFRANVE